MSDQHVFAQMPRRWRYSREGEYRHGKVPWIGPGHMVLIPKLYRGKWKNAWVWQRVEEGDEDHPDEGLGLVCIPDRSEWNDQVDADACDSEWSTGDSWTG